MPGARASIAADKCRRPPAGHGDRFLPPLRRRDRPPARLRRRHRHRHASSMRGAVILAKHRRPQLLWPRQARHDRGLARARRARARGGPYPLLFRPCLGRAGPPLVRRAGRRQRPRPPDAPRRGGRLGSAGLAGRARSLESSSASACSKSAIRSSASSTPIEIRTRLSVMPSACLRSSGTDRWVIAAGALASVSVPPRLTASLAILSASRKAKASLLAALQIEREGRAGAGAVAAIDVGLAGVAAILEEAEIADRLDLGLVAKQGADLGRILAGLAHPQLERLEASQQHPGGVGIGDRADRVAHHPDRRDQRLGADDAAGDEVAMAAGIFGQRIDGEVGALVERLRPERPEEGVVDRDRRLLLVEQGVARGARPPRRRPERWSGWRGFRDRSARPGPCALARSITASISSRVAPAGKSSQLTPKRPRMRPINVSVAA